MTSDPAPPPWRSRFDALLWWHRAAAAARAELPAGLRRGPIVPVTVAGLVAYRDGPVGPYRELFGVPVLRAGTAPAHVAFMAVDDERSLAGGRRNWALPKEPADFDGDPLDHRPLSVAGEAWRLTLRTDGPRWPLALPAAGAIRCAQAWPDGAVRAFTIAVVGRARLATVVVGDVAPASLAAWLRPGRHPAVVLSGRQHVGAPGGP